jgi:hypothetical protein
VESDPAAPWGPVRLSPENLNGRLQVAASTDDPPNRPDVREVPTPDRGITKALSAIGNAFVVLYQGFRPIGKEAFDEAERRRRAHTGQ